MSIRIERVPAPWWMRLAIPLAAVVVTFALTAVLVVWAKANPLEAYYYFLIAPSSRSAYRVCQSTPCSSRVRRSPSPFPPATGISVWKVNCITGAIAAAGLGTVLGGLPPILALPLMLLGGFLAGMLWALVPALLRVKLAIDEVVTTLLLNSVILFFVSFLLNGPWTSLRLASPQIEQCGLPETPSPFSAAPGLHRGDGGRGLALVRAFAHSAGTAHARRRPGPRGGSLCRD
jgi:simple sugar transport system permease protein